MKLFFLIRSLGHGGAERQLIELVKRLDSTRFEITVATFYDGGALRPELERVSGIRVISLQKKSRWDVVSFLVRLHRAVRGAAPDLIHGYLGIANELALIFGRLAGARVVWGLRMSQMDYSRHDWATGVSDRIGAGLSRFTDLMIANSHAGRNDYAAAGYRADRITVVSNGIDTARFRPDADARRRVRAEWKVRDGELLVGMVGRINPQKDHANFLRAAAKLAAGRPGVRFACVGDGPAELRDSLDQLARDSGLDGRVLWIRGSNDMTGVNNAFDLATLASAYGEGFPNVIGEAMSCGVPVVATDVGDSALIVGNPGQIVPPRNADALAMAWQRVIELPAAERAALGTAHRTRILNTFSMEHLTAKTVELLEALR